MVCGYKPLPSKSCQAWIKSFASWYNGEHLLSAIRFVTPNERHTGFDRTVLASRAVLYANARAQKLERWSGKTRNWQPAGPVWLNPENKISAPEIRDAEWKRWTISLTNTAKPRVGMPHSAAMVPGSRDNPVASAACDGSELFANNQP